MSSVSTRPAAYDDLVELVTQSALFNSCARVLGWDRETHMPVNGTTLRAEQLGLLSGMIHEQRTDPKIGELLDDLEGSGAIDSDSVEAANLREIRRDYDLATKRPRRLVEELSKTITFARSAWEKARKDDDFATFAPHLEKVLELKREEAEVIGSPTEHPYDALLDEYEPGATSEPIAKVFAELREGLVPLLAELTDSPNQPDESIIERSYPIDAQRRFGIAAATAIGFDFDAGRLDETAHPFCSGIGPGDCRLTTRYDEHHFSGAFFGTLHEAGHGMYEQGLPDDQFGLPTGESSSLGIHESQSRMWENMVGRSDAFWNHFWSDAVGHFPEALGDVQQQDFVRAINVVRPSFIRVEADEVTYNLHIMLRFTLERDLVSGQLTVNDLPGAWRDAFRESFGVEVPTDREGCLQDIHWGSGLIGYFPTYALGNMYAAQFFRKADEELGGLAEMFGRGEFLPLREWLRTNIHQHGRRYSAPELLRRVTGEELSAAPLLAHLRQRFRPLYGLEN